MTPKAEKEYWEDPTIISENKEDGHATLIPFDSKKEAISGIKESSNHYRSLNGEWHFNWVKRPAERPIGFYKNDYTGKNNHLLTPKLLLRYAPGHMREIEGGRLKYSNLYEITNIRFS